MADVSADTDLVGFSYVPSVSLHGAKSVFCCHGAQLSQKDPAVQGQGFVTGSEAIPKINILSTPHMLRV